MAGKIPSDTPDKGVRLTMECDVRAAPGWPPASRDALFGIHGALPWTHLVLSVSRRTATFNSSVGVDRQTEPRGILARTRVVPA